MLMPKLDQNQADTDIVLISYQMWLIVAYLERFRRCRVNLRLKT